MLGGPMKMGDKMNATQRAARRRWSRRGYAVGLVESVDQLLQRGRGADSPRLLAVSVGAEWGRFPHQGPTAAAVAAVLRSFRQ